MSAPPYMKLFWGDYHKATRHLTTGQHGAYFLLIGEAWRLGGSLPDDDAKLARWALCTDPEWTAMRATILGFFEFKKGRHVHDRVRKELAHYRAVSRKRKAAGKTGGSSSSGKNKENTQAIATQLPTKPEPESKPKKKKDLGGGETRSRELSPESCAAALVSLKGFPSLARPAETQAQMAARLRALT